MTQFKTLFLVAVAHGYYSDGCEDIGFLVPSDTVSVLQNGKLLAKPLSGKLYVLFETDDAGVALVTIPGQTLRFGLQLSNPFFSNFTKLDSSFATSQFLYRNAAASTSLDSPQAVTLVGQRFSH